MSKSIVDEKNIKGFFEDYRFMSNFHECPVTYKGVTYRCSEAAFMSEKCLDPEVKAKFIPLIGVEAKKLGKTVQLRADWEDVKDQVMYDVNLAKYSQNEGLKQRLIDTGDKYLEETNWWKDTYWGVCDGVGRNQLGITLMEVREQLKNGAQG